MYNITLVCTHHSELGKCTSDELYKIIDSIRPDVIFEELPQELFDRFYKENSIPFDPPEVKAVKRYIQRRAAIHIPVDINPNDKLSLNDIDYLFNTLSKYNAYAKLEEDQKKLIFQEGYDFLNSKKNEELIERKRALEKNLIAFQMNRHQFSRMYELFYEEIHNREHEIIKNIYNYSTGVTYNQAVLLLGSGHRKTMFEKIANYESKYYVKLNWNLYGI